MEIFENKQKEEAITRMKMLKLDKPCIQAFGHGEVWESEGFGALYELRENEQAIVDEFQKEHKGCLVYHVIHNMFEFGECYSLLYVSNDEQEWEQDKEDIINGYIFVYVKNVDEEWCSEFGSIAIKPSFGGLMRLS